MKMDRIRNPPLVTGVGHLLRESAIRTVREFVSSVLEEHFRPLSAGLFQWPTPGLRLVPSDNTLHFARLVESVFSLKKRARRPGKHSFPLRLTKLRFNVVRSLCQKRNASPFSQFSQSVKVSLRLYHSIQYEVAELFKLASAMRACQEQVGSSSDPSRPDLFAFPRGHTSWMLVCSSRQCQMSRTRSPLAYPEFTDVCSPITLLSLMHRTGYHR